MSQQELPSSPPSLRPPLLHLRGREEPPLGHRRPLPPGSRDEEADTPPGHHFPACTQVSLREGHQVFYLLALEGPLLAGGSFTLPTLLLYGDGRAAVVHP